MTKLKAQDKFKIQMTNAKTKLLYLTFIPYPENHVCKGMDEWFSGGIPLHERKTEKSETTAVKPWSFII